MSFFADFARSLATSDPVSAIRDGIIGHDAMVDGPFGAKRTIYADYVASGRALQQIETAIMNGVLPYYANSHTEASFVGGHMTRLRRQARDIVAAACGATQAHATIFTGSGATAGINRLVHLFGVAQDAAAGRRPVVLIGPYEHHSNILPWRESGAEVITVPECADSGPCPDALAEQQAALAGRSVIAAFSAASNVTGITADVVGLTRQLNAAGVRVVWDYAGGGPYLPISMDPAPGAQIDALVVSPHKFIGGPQASGVLVVRKDAVRAYTPSAAGGGTVRFVSGTGHDYSQNIEAREEAGTPNVIGDIRAALAFLVKDAIGTDWISSRNTKLSEAGLKAWGNDPAIDLLGGTERRRLPIFSFRIHAGHNDFVHQQLVTRLLSDVYGIQARGGCACAGPYVHDLLGIDSAASERMRHAILSGNEVAKPGFTRLNLCHIAGDGEIAFILRAVTELARSAAEYVPLYRCDTSTAIFQPVANTLLPPHSRCAS